MKPLFYLIPCSVLALALALPSKLNAVELQASDGATSDSFGRSVSQSGSVGIVGAEWDNIGANSDQGSAYVFRNLDTATGTITQNVKLTAADGESQDYFGHSVSLSGSIGLVGAYADNIGANSDQGSAYVFRNLDTATGTVTENVKLTASDGEASDNFGSSVSQSGSIGLVGATGDNIGANFDQGSAYVFRNLDTATGTVTQNVKLTASDGEAGDIFGISVNQSGSSGLVGASYDDIGANFDQGSAYLFRNLDTATGTVTENVKLISSDGALSDSFGSSVSQSGSIGLVGAYRDNIGANSDQGSAYVFRNLDTATGTVTQNVKLTASDGTQSSYFGRSVSLSGDSFTIGAIGGDGVSLASGKAYVGTISSMTTLDTGNSSRTISGISFISQDDWIIGQTTDNNLVTLTDGDSADVTASGKAVFVGKNAGSDNNTLLIEGTLTANIVNIGSTDGNIGNTLQLDSTAVFGPVSFRLAPGNFLSIQGDFTNTGNLFTYLDSSTLQVWEGGLWATVNGGNASSHITSNYSSGYTTVSVVPEPSTCALLALGGAASFLSSRRKKRTA